MRSVREPVSKRWRAQRPHLAPDANRSNHRIDELDAQNSWQHHIDTGLLKVR